MPFDWVRHRKTTHASFHLPKPLLDALKPRAAAGGSLTYT